MVDLVTMEKLLVICGPTGTGKTDLAIKLAKKFNGEIVSADSRQVYLGMDIATGKEVQNSQTKIEKEEGKWIVNDIPIYLYDIITPDKKFSLAEYQQLALEKIKAILAKGKLPILVGGTGLYIQSVTEGLKIPKAPPDHELREKLDSQKLEDLLVELEKIDPASFEGIDKNNKRRVMRALEVFYQTGESFSSLQKKFKVGFEVLKLGLTSDRETLYSKNDQRVENWFVLGFVDEVKNLLKNYSVDLASMSGIGYRQVASYISGNLGLEEVKQRVKFDVHGYIRRQLTWFKRDRTIYWYDVKEEKLLTEITALVESWLGS